MADAKTLQDAFIDELRDAYDAEKQLLRALPKMTKEATSEDLTAAFEAHLEETRGHVDKLEQVFGALDEKGARQATSWIGCQIAGTENVFTQVQPADLAIFALAYPQLSAQLLP